MSSPWTSYSEPETRTVAFSIISAESPQRMRYLAILAILASLRLYSHPYADSPRYLSRPTTTTTR